MRTETIPCLALAAASILGAMLRAGQQASLAPREEFVPEIPAVWDPEEIEAIELPLAYTPATPRHMTAEQYYSMPVRPVYASYPIYHPDYEPEGYLEELESAEPQMAWDRKSLRTRQDWIDAGELIFDLPITFDDILTMEEVRDPYWYDAVEVPITPQGVMPFARYVVREQGVVEVGNFSCAMCHTRVLPDGRVVKGAQSNFALGRSDVYRVERQEINEPERFHLFDHFLFGAPWIEGRSETIEQASMEEMLAHYEANPPGAMTRQGAALWQPIQVPDLIGVRDRLYLDHSAVQRQHGIVDLMRYAAINQGAGDFASFDGFRPIEVFGPMPELEVEEPDLGAGRHSDEQLYALSLFVYSLEPPENPNPRNALAERGKTVFERQNCARCHTPPLYTSDQLLPAPGFEVPADHPDRERILRTTIGTDPALALESRRGTGLYKIPSLLGVWYRGAFSHTGSVLTLEEWFDPRRLREDFQPSGWKPAGTTTWAVRGHEFGLDLSEEDRAALIAFLKTL